MEFEKRFDRVEWEFIDKTLQTFNFGFFSKMGKIAI